VGDRHGLFVQGAERALRLLALKGVPVAKLATGGDLADFVKLFNPATPSDAQLIRAAILTLFWGGPP
jgi:hypothetical protein